MFFEETNNVEQFEGVSIEQDSRCLRTVEDTNNWQEKHIYISYIENSRKLLQKLNSIFRKCFEKIRITGKRNKKDDTIVYMEMKTQLQFSLKN